MARVVVLRRNTDAVRRALEGGSLHAWASHQAGAVALAGRGTAWAVSLPDGAPVVVRRSRHGGALAPLTGELFLRPTRAPRELATAVRLASAGVPTPDVVAYAVYPSVWPLARADVVTRRITGDAFPEAWRAAAGAGARMELVRALAGLLRRLHEAGALHPDLNLRNVLVSGAPGGATAFVLDVDRVAFGRPGARTIAERNLARVVRSARKRRHEWGIDLDDDEFIRLLSSSLDGSPGGSRQ